MDPYSILRDTQRLRVSDGVIASLLDGYDTTSRLLILVWPQLGDFDSLEYAWWLRRDAERLVEQDITVRAVGIGDRASGQQFCAYTGFPEAWLFVDPAATLHQQLGLYPGLQLNIP
ncbi:MAG: hypothetical protein F6K30_05235, partial [Cyanothece sp. SIO2G6]|nr:hypothetical protein [Cyanothece sp. SIO2G6]